MQKSLFIQARVNARQNRDPRYKIDKQKNGQKQSPSPNPKSNISRYRRGRQESSTGKRAKVKNQESDVRINQRDKADLKNQRGVNTRISILLVYLELGSGI